MVDADENTQLERLAKRGLDREAALKRVRSQNPQAEKLARADVIIYNEGTPDETWAQVRAAWKQVQTVMQQGDVEELVRRVDVAPGQHQPAAGQRAITSIDILRGMPQNAEQIASVLKLRTGRDLSREDVIMLLGQRSYMMAVADGRPLGLVGFVVENLVMRADELFVLKGAPVRPTISALLDAVEQASKALQSEIGYIFARKYRARYGRIGSPAGLSANEDRGDPGSRLARSGTRIATSRDGDLRQEIARGAGARRSSPRE